jgi:hypothetical protein
MYGAQLLARLMGCAVSVESAAVVGFGYAHGQGRTQNSRCLQLYVHASNGLTALSF